MNDPKNLFQLLKPKAKRNLVRNKIQFPTTANNLISTLKKLHIKSDLTVNDVSALHTFTGTDCPSNPVDLLYCNDIFKAYEK